MNSIQKEREAFEDWYIRNMDTNGDFEKISEQDSPYMDEHVNNSWLTWQAAQAQAVPEGFVLVEKEKINTWYQDDNEPENFCNSIDALDSLGDCIDHDEIMIVNKHTQAHLSTEKLYGAWGVIETSYGTRWKFKLFNTEDEAKSAIVEAKEPAND